VEHSVPYEPAARPWRTLTLIASAVAAVEFLILFSVFVAKPLVGHLRRAAVASATGSAADIPKPPPVGKPKLLRSHTKVVVLNGNGVTDAAGAEARRVRARGYRVTSVADAGRTDYPSSIVMYRAGYRPEGVRLRRDLRLHVIGPLDGMKPRALHGAQLVVIVGGS
jgi:hypothetical protein